MKHLFSFVETYVDWLSFGVSYNLERAGLRIRDEKGAISIELAIVVAILVAIAVAVGAVLFIRARDSADAIPDAPTPTTRFSSGG